MRQGGSARDSEFADFVTASHVSLLRTARLLTGDPHTAEDLVQTALIRVYTHWGRSAGWDSPQAYARKAVVNLYATWRRRRWHSEVAHTGAESAADGHDMAGSAEARLELGRALGALPRAQRAVVVLRYYEDLSVEQTAELLGCSPGTVKSRTNRALERLRTAGALAGYAGRGAR
ncbi:MAG TPA: SigE family RNA polymerase sigma factor [Streptomyces sp.]|nr:SigE family RNA polymerase sigma factor [Streptomyces sp.]HET6359471.1 SigE family RNA polymerase sigma factor [Streptomyces sp.]